MAEMTDVATERALLCGLVQNGREALVDIQDIIGPTSFSDTSNSIIYTCLCEMFNDNYEYDLPSFISAASGLNFGEIINNNQQLEYIKSLSQMKVEIDNVRKHAVKLSKLSLIRKLQSASRETYKALDKLTGTESIDKIMSTAEKEIFAATTELNGGSDSNVELIGDAIFEYLEWLEQNECDQIGVPSPYKRWSNVTGGGYRRGTTTLMGARPKTGKALSLDSDIYTPFGPVKMRDIELGDLVSTPDGETAVVYGIYPQGRKQLYRVTFDDSSTVECCKEHLWYVAKNRRNKYDYEVKSLESIMDEGLYYSDRPKWKIPIADYVHFVKQKTLIDPYILGCLLGDGGLTSGPPIISSSDSEIIESFSGFASSYGLKLTKKSRYDYSIVKDTASENILTSYLREYNLMDKDSHNKFIPDVYKYNSIEVRKQIARGLMDTDGSNSDGKYAEYTSVSLNLIEDVREILESIGYKCSISSRFTSYPGSERQFKSYRLYISGEDVNDLFTLKRKIYKTKRTKGKLFRKIVNVEKIGRKKCQCISVNSNDKLYMTNNFVVTHNTTVAKDIGLYSASNGIPVLILDTEMNSKDQKNKLLSSISKVGTNIIEKGKFGKDPSKKNSVMRAAKQIESLPYYYKSICGKSFDDVLSIIRRWIFQYVGFNEDGSTKDCLVIYDYFKLQEASKLESVQEYQALGFQIADMTNFCIQYDIPTVAFVQINREGIEKESAASISQSDRLLWLCASYTMIKKKTDEEIEEDGIRHGNMKFIPLEARFGPGLKDGDYINVSIDGPTAYVEELVLKSEIIQKGNNGDSDKIAD